MPLSRDGSLPDIDEVKARADHILARFGSRPSVVGRHLFIPRAVPPPILYKYTSANSAKLILQSSSVRYTPASHLDDVFEEGVSRELIEKIRDDYEDGPTFVIDIFDPEERLANFDRVYETRRALRAAGVILSDDVILITAEGFDPAWRYELGNRRLKEALEKARVPLAFCLSELENNGQLWSLYGDMHKGVCLGFSSRHEYFRNNRDRISSSGFFSQIQYRSLTIEDYCYRFPSERFFLKTPDWSWQREWRRIEFKRKPLSRTDDEAISLFDLPPSALASVAFGARCSESDVRELTEVISNSPLYSHLNIYRTIVSLGGSYQERIF